MECQRTEVFLTSRSKVCTSPPNPHTAKNKNTKFACKMMNDLDTAATKIFQHLLCFEIFFLIVFARHGDGKRG